MADVLAEAADAVFGKAAGGEERFADGGGEAADDDIGDKSGEEKGGVAVKEAVAGVTGVRVVPVRRSGYGGKEGMQFGGRGYGVELVLHTGVEEDVDLGLVEVGQRGDGGVSQGVADAGVLDIAAGKLGIDGLGFGVTVPIGGRDAVNPIIHKAGVLGAMGKGRAGGEG